MANSYLDQVGDLKKVYSPVLKYLTSYLEGGYFSNLFLAHTVKIFSNFW